MMHTLALLHVHSHTPSLTCSLTHSFPPPPTLPPPSPSLTPPLTQLHPRTLHVLLLQALMESRSPGNGWKLVTPSKVMRCLSGRSPIATGGRGRPCSSMHQLMKPLIYLFNEAKPFTPYKVSVDGVLSANGEMGTVQALAATLVTSAEQSEWSRQLV